MFNLHGQIDKSWMKMVDRLSTCRLNVPLTLQTRRNPILHVPTHHGRNTEYHHHWRDRNEVNYTAKRPAAGVAHYYLPELRCCIHISETGRLRKGEGI